MLIRGITTAINRGSLRVNRIISKNIVYLWIWLWLVKIYDALLNKGKIKGQIEKTIDQFNNGEGKSLLYKEILYCREVNLIYPEEYFLYNFASLSVEARRSFVGNREKELLCLAINRNHAWKIFTDKWQTYSRFCDYYHREVIRISSNEDREKYLGFLKKYGCGVLKVANSSCGRGIILVEKSQSDDVWRKISNSWDAGYVLEEKVRQSEQMSIFNRTSVNTVRLATYIKDGEVVCLFAVLRTGRSGQIVDNGGSGGVIASIDMETGIVSSNGRNEAGEVFERHPDSKTVFKGFQMPEWEKARELAGKLAKIVPEQLYVGWDLAYTDKGWTMIEGNSWGQFLIMQMCSLIGLRKEINETFYYTINKYKEAK